MALITPHLPFFLSSFHCREPFPAYQHISAPSDQRETEREGDAEITPRLRPSLQESFGWLHLKDHYAQNSGWLTTNPLRLKPLWNLRAQCLNLVLLDRQVRLLRGGPAVYEVMRLKGKFIPFKNRIIRIQNNKAEEVTQKAGWVSQMLLALLEHCVNNHISLIEIQ